ncbi:hypothetical protein AYI68_g6809 [Smittium mucronatum]|uniref:Uncharacterized protein n=1 Tax=Smittium mucronatum TaxID=133383 RepID=A0A1R0GQH0_9FUNG|nr:hypothetical protein AYI68_g6809 [Smittium mucronatum]
MEKRQNNDCPNPSLDSLDSSKSKSNVVKDVSRNRSETRKLSNPGNNLSSDIMAIVENFSHDPKLLEAILYAKSEENKVKSEREIRLAEEIRLEQKKADLEILRRNQFLASERRGYGYPNKVQFRPGQTKTNTPSYLNHRNLEIYTNQNPLHTTSTLISPSSNGNLNIDNSAQTPSNYNEQLSYRKRAYPYERYNPPHSAGVSSYYSNIRPYSREFLDHPYDSNRLKKDRESNTETTTKRQATEKFDSPNEPHDVEQVSKTRQVPENSNEAIPIIDSERLGIKRSEIENQDNITVNSQPNITHSAKKCKQEPMPLKTKLKKRASLVASGLSIKTSLQDLGKDGAFDGETLSAPVDSRPNKKKIILKEQVMTALRNKIFSIEAKRRNNASGSEKICRSQKTPDNTHSPESRNASHLQTFSSPGQGKTKLSPDNLLPRVLDSNHLKENSVSPKPNSPNTNSESIDKCIKYTSEALSSDTRGLRLQRSSDVNDERNKLHNEYPKNHNTPPRNRISEFINNSNATFSPSSKKFQSQKLTSSDDSLPYIDSSSVELSKSANKSSDSENTSEPAKVSVSKSKLSSLIINGAQPTYIRPRKGRVVSCGDNYTLESKEFNKIPKGDTSRNIQPRKQASPTSSIRSTLP